MASSPTNAELAAALEEYAALLELSGANAYATRAYRRAATLIHATPVDVAALVREGRVRDLRGIGAGIEQRLQELVREGQIAELEVLRRGISLELAAFGRMHGFAARAPTSTGGSVAIPSRSSAISAMSRAADRRSASVAGRTLNP